MDLIRHAYNFEKFKEYIEEHQQILDSEKLKEFLEAGILYNNIPVIKLLVTEKNVEIYNFVPMLYSHELKEVLTFVEDIDINYLDEDNHP